MQFLLGHFRYAIRQFRLSPIFTSAAILTLALGIGGTTAIFTLMNAIMLRSLPVADPALLYRVGDGDDCCVEGSPQTRWGIYSFPLYERLREAAPEFEEAAAFQAGEGRLGVRRAGVNSPAKPLRSEYVTGQYFSTLGIKAFTGRLLSPEDDRAGSPPAAVLSHQSWQAQFGSDPSIVGATFVLEGHPFTVVGIAPPGFFGETLRSRPPQIWVPVHQEPLIAGTSTMLHEPSAAWLRMIGRLRKGSSVAGLGPKLTTTLRSWMQHDSEYPANWMPDVVRNLSKQVVNVVPAGSGVEQMKEDYGRSLQILLAVCGMVLLIACANVANLLLARAVARRGQTALRLAIGANRRQVIGQSLLEAVLLALGGALAGIVVSVLAARLLLRLTFPGATSLPIDPWPSPLVLSFACGVALLTGIIFGSAPAWFATKTDPVEALRGAERSTADHSSFARKALLIAQIALSVVLVAGSLMLAQSLNKLEHQNFGYQINGRVIVDLNQPPSSYTQSQLVALYRQIEDGLNAMPGVKGSGLALYNPLTDNWGELIMVAGHPPSSLSAEAGSSWDRVSTNYLQNFGVKLLRGRFFTGADNDKTAPVAIVNEAFVKRFFKAGEDPLGQHFGLDMPANAGDYQIVGIIRDAKFASFALDRPARPMFYSSLSQYVHYPQPIMQRIENQSHYIGGLMLVTDLPAGVIESQVTRLIAGIDPNLTINSVKTMGQQVEATFDQERAVASLAGLFGVVALILAAVGLYGVTSYTVAQRTNEIGLRIALGSDRAGVISYILKGAFLRVAIGLCAGLPLSVLAGRVISSQLYGVSFWDPLALSISAGALAVCAFFAAIIPALLASSISPMTALRAE